MEPTTFTFGGQFVRVPDVKLRFADGSPYPHGYYVWVPIVGPVPVPEPKPLKRPDRPPGA